MKKQLLIVCLLLLSLCSYAQTLTVKGTVTSASDKEPYSTSQRYRKRFYYRTGW